MLKNYFKIAFRNIWKNKASSFINILGLTVGLTCCLLIGIYIQHELNYDDFEQNGDRIARVIMSYKFDGGAETKKGNYTSVRVAKVFKQTFPEVQSAVRMAKYSEVVQYRDKLINEKNFMFADSSFFNIFSFKLIQGDVSTALNGPRKVVLTEATAKKYFADENPVGKTLKLQADSSLYLVTGVMANCPSNSQIKFDFLASFTSLNISKEHENSYWDANYTTYLLLRDKNAIATLQAKIEPFMKKEMEGKGATVNFLLEPFKKIHLYSEFDGFEPNNSITYIYILEGVALLILFIACFTYINLNTARSIERAREVGVRKVIGADKQQLFWQFIGESALICAIATLLSVVTALLLMPYFNELTEKQLQLSAFITPQFIGGTLLLIIVISLLAGSYPALILSNFQPVKVLKGAFKNTDSGQWMRKSLIVFQFCISVVLIVCTVVMQRQLNYIQNKKLGYDRDHVLVLPIDYKMAAKIPVLKQEFKSNSNILSVSACANTPVNILGGYNMRSSTMPESQQIAVTADPIDEDFVKTAGLQIIAGEDLNLQDIKDATYPITAQTEPADYNKTNFHFILNESAARELGWTASSAIGKRMFLDATRPGVVKAVVKDFNFESMHTAIKPLVLFPEEGGRRLRVKIKGSNIAETIAFMDTKWKSLITTRPFEYHFMDEDFNKLYSAETRLGKVLNLFAATAILLACLGLLGLSSYTAKQRVKEIGIRKVLGAGVGNIAALLSVDFVKMVLLSVIIASPLAWLMMRNWLQGFAYRIDINAWIFLLSGVLAVGIALATVSFQAIKAALTNPVKNLRND